MYQALYRKYRPQTFDDVVGQSSIVKVLKNSIEQRKFCHAYMFLALEVLVKHLCLKYLQKQLIAWNRLMVTLAENVKIV